VEADREAGREALRERVPEGRWLSYTELAEIRGIGRPSAVKLAQRERWRRIPGNDRDRTVRVLVPSEWLQPSKATLIREAAPDGIPDAVPEFTRQLDAANARADEANKRADATLALADRLGAQLADAAARAERAEQRVEEVLAGQLLMAETYARELVVAQHDAKAARQAADELRQAEAARQGQGRWARLRAAWRGE